MRVPSFIYASRSVGLAAALLLGVTISACTDGPSNASADRKAIARELVTLGLWRGLSDADREANVADVERGVHPWATNMSTSVQFPADGEALAEGGVEEFVASLNQALRAFGVEAVASTVKAASTGEYVVAIDDEVIHLYDATSWTSEVESEQPWYSATMKPLAVLNRRLAAAGVKERFFVLYPGGNEGVALLIDPQIVDLLQDAGLVDGMELPVEAQTLGE